MHSPHVYLDLILKNIYIYITKLIFELDFSSILNWIFAGYTDSKNQIQIPSSDRYEIKYNTFLVPWRLDIPNGCLDAYEVKVNIDIFKYQENVKLISQFQRFFHFSMAY